jgi:hypothetical protein
LNARWKEFEARDFEGRIALYRATLEDEELMDDEMAFEMLNSLYQEMARRNQRGRILPLVKALRKRRPEVYKQGAPYYLSWLISDALAWGPPEKVPVLARNMARTAGRNIDIFNRTREQLEYHGRLATLVEIMPIAWLRVKKSTNVVPWGVTEFADRAAGYEIFAYLERTPSPDARDPALHERLKVYVEDVDWEYLENYVTHLSGRSSRVWTIGDFTMRPPRRKSRRGDDDGDEEEAPDPGRRNLAYLMADFLGHVHREEKVSLTRGNLGAKGLLEYFNQRHDGRLEATEGLWEPRRRSGKRPPQGVAQSLAQPLCPDSATLDRFLGSYLGFLNFMYYPAAATFELIPAWLRFLNARQLLDADRQARMLQGLEGLKGTLLKLWQEHKDDPTLQEGLRKVWGLEVPPRLPEPGNRLSPPGAGADAATKAE